MNLKIEKGLAKVVLHIPVMSLITSNWKKVEETDEVPTMAVDGKNLYYNPEYVQTLNISEVTGVLLHEIVHCLFLHPHAVTELRCKDMIRPLWQIALEIVTNATVLDICKENPGLDASLPGESFSPLTKDMFKEKPRDKIYFYDPMGHNHTAEEIYEALYKKYGNVFDELNEIAKNVLRQLGLSDEEGAKTKGNNPTIGDIIENGDRDDIQQNTERAIATIEKLAKSKGDIPGSLMRLLKKLTESKLPWNRILHNIVGSIIKGADDFSWNCPNWKHPLSNEILLPGEIEYQKEDVVVAVDTSGSISNKELESFAGEIAKLGQYVSEILVVTCDAKVHEKVKICNVADFLKKLKFKGGGGTDFRPVFNEIKRCSLLVFFTDGFGDYPERPPKYPVVWVLTDSANPPFGKSVKLVV